MKKAIVIGCPGAGKSCFSKKLRDKTGIVLYHLDNIWHLPDKTNISKEEFDQRLAAILKTESWILDGNYSRTMEERIKACDTVFLLDYPLDVCLAGARERVGVKRDDLPWLERELDPEFEQWIIDFPTKELPQIYRLLYANKKKRKIVVFHSRKEAEEFLNGL